MAEFVVNASRLDPHKNFKFRVKWSATYVPGIFRVSGLSRTTAVVEYRSGGSSNVITKSPGLTTYEPITLDRPRTHDTAFEDWANSVWHLGAAAGAEVMLHSYRRDIIIEVNNEAGQLALSWVVRRCWPSHYEAFVDLGAGESAILVERLVLAHEGFERDLSVPETSEK